MGVFSGIPQISPFAQVLAFLEPTGKKGQGAPLFGLQTVSQSPFFDILPRLHPYLYPCPQAALLGFSLPGE